MGAALALLLFAPLPSSAQSRTKTRSVGETANGCVDFRVTDAPARLDDHHTLYVEQEAVSAQRDGRVLVAGQPVFLWRHTGARQELIEQDSIIGMVITPPFKLRALTSPLRGRSLTSIRSVGLPDGWWLMTFAEIVPEQSPAITPRVLALWAAETDGSTWRRVERLPTVSDSLVLATNATSELSYGNQHVLFAMQSVRGAEPRVVLYERGAAAWSATSVYLGNRAYVAAAETDSHELLAVVRNDSTEQEDFNSLFLYARAHGDTAWTNRGRLVRGYRTPVRDPHFDARSDGVLLTWSVSSENGREDDGWFTRLGTAGELLGPIRHVTDQARLLYHAARGDRGVWVGSNGRRPLRGLQLVEHDGSTTPIHSVVSTNTYGGLLGAALTADFLTIIASQPGASTDDPAVISIIKSYPWRCH